MAHGNWGDDSPDVGLNAEDVPRPAASITHVASWIYYANSLERKNIELEGALALINADMHIASARPCVTCQKITKIVGYNFGCRALKDIA